MTDRSSIYFGLTIDEARRREAARQRELNQQKARQQEEQKRREDDLCNNALHAVPWHHQTSDGKTFMCADFYERASGDRKSELDEAARQIKARFYREDLDKRKKEGNVYRVVVYFYK